MYNQYRDASQFFNNEQYGVAVALQHSNFRPNNGVNDIGLLRLYGEVTHYGKLTNVIAQIILRLLFILTTHYFIHLFHLQPTSARFV